jgi:putative membrane protein
VAVISFWVPPTVLSAQVALQRGVSESLPLTQTNPQAFRGNIKPENRTLIDWIRTLNAYPEPDAYQGQKAKITGFVIHLPQLPPNYLLLSRFVLTCCAVDAYPVGIPIKLEGDRSVYPPDSWLTVEGAMLTESLPFDSQTLKAIPRQKRQLVLEAQSIQQIPTPSDPYSY